MDLRDMIPKGKLRFWLEVGRGTIPAQKANHGRGLHHGLAVVLSGKEILVSRGQPRPWPPPRSGRGCLWKFGFMFKYHTTAVAFTTGWPWLALEIPPRAWSVPHPGRGCLCL